MNLKNFVLFLPLLALLSAYAHVSKSSDSLSLDEARLAAKSGDLGTRIEAFRAYSDLLEQGEVSQEELEETVVDAFSYEVVGSPLRVEISRLIAEDPKEYSLSFVLQLFNDSANVLRSFAESRSRHAMDAEHETLMNLMSALFVQGGDRVRDAFYRVATDNRMKAALAVPILSKYFLLGNEGDNDSKLERMLADYPPRAPSIHDYLSGRPGVMSVDALKAYALEDAMVELGGESLEFFTKELSNTEAGLRKERLAIVLAKSVAARLDSGREMAIAEKRAVKLLSGFYETVPKNEKYGNHFYLLQQLSLIKEKSKERALTDDVLKAIDKADSSMIDEEEYRIRKEEYQRNEWEEKSSEVKSLKLFFVAYEKGDVPLSIKKVDEAIETGDADLIRFVTRTIRARTSKLSVDERYSLALIIFERLVEIDDPKEVYLLGLFANLKSEVFDSYVIERYEDLSKRKKIASIGRFVRQGTYFVADMVARDLGDDRDLDNSIYSLLTRIGIDGWRKGYTDIEPELRARGLKLESP